MPERRAPVDAVSSAGRTKPAACHPGRQDNNDVFVCTTVLLETEWVLRSVFGFSANQCAKALTGFAGLPRVTLEDPAVVAKALGWMQQRMDFADALHLAKAEHCDAFITFDR